MWGNILLLSMVKIGTGEQLTEVHRRKLANDVSLETVKVLDFHDENVVDNLAKSVIETESDKLVGQILHMLSDSNVATSNKKLRTELKKMILDPRYKMKPGTKNRNHNVPLPNGIIKLLKANMAVAEKKKVLEQVHQKMERFNSFSQEDYLVELNAIPREARFTNEDFPYDSLVKDANKGDHKHDLSNCEVQTDGSCCISKVHEDERLERDDIKECWHKNVTTCYDSYVTEFTSAEEEKCEDVFYKNCVIDFKQVPFDSEIQSCHVPMVKDCSDDVDGEEICKTYSETTCNTTYDEEWQPETACASHPRKVCAPDSCQVVQGEEVCMTKTMVSTTYQPVERCDLQPQTHCRVVTKPVPKLVVVPNCYTQEKEVCRRKQGLPRPAGKQTLVRWCKKQDGLSGVNYGKPFPKKGDMAALELSLKDKSEEVVQENGNIKPQFTISDLLRKV